MSKEELKPCPLHWCSGKGRFHRWQEWDNWFVKIECDDFDCNCSTPAYDNESLYQAIDDWNTRPIEDQAYTAGYNKAIEDASEFVKTHVWAQPNVGRARFIKAHSGTTQEKYAEAISKLKKG